ncbi:hypothetical protein CRM22_009061 [Opisthorchis felineus]|uniref:C2H2-type domain-containing protein n=1 Tax=Opisthorchis felineus TaxID=147828 RepID=A0A4S2LGF3_OPIFE|nr:hypothetical protein CRM22_009061 [Opisthorchis felineus]
MTVRGQNIGDNHSKMTPPIRPSDSLTNLAGVLCRFCRKSGWGSPESLFSHVNEVHQVLAKPYPCHDCRLTGFIRKGDLMQHQKCGTCLGVDWEKSWDRATNMLATENRGVNRKSSFNGSLNGSCRSSQSSSCMGDEKPSCTPLRKRHLSMPEPISPPTKHKVSAGGSTGKKESVKNVATNTSDVLKTSDTGRDSEGSTSITQFSMKNPKSSTSSVGRCSLLDWDSFISLPKKRRSLSLKSRSESVVQCKSQVTTSVTPKLNTSLLAAEKTNSLSENCVGELEGTVSERRAEPSSKIGALEDIMVETIPEIDPDVIRSIKKHPKAIAGSTISPSSIISPVLTVHGIMDAREKERFSPSVLNSSNSGVRLVNSDSLGLSHCTLSRSPVRKKRTWVHSTHSVEFCETSVTKIANSLMPPSKKVQNQAPSLCRPATDLSTRLRTSQADHNTPSSPTNETDCSLYSTHILNKPASMTNSLTNSHRLSNGSQTTEGFLDQSKGPAYDSPNDEHIMISKSALRPRKSAGSPSVTACPRCSCTVLHPNGLQRHLKVCKGVLRDTDNEDTLTPLDGPPPPSSAGHPPKPGVLRCPHCNRRFEKACGIVIHVRTCKGADNEISNLHPASPEDQITTQKVEKSFNSIAKLSDIPKESLPSNGPNRILESDVDARSRSKLPKPESSAASKASSPSTRLRSRSSTPSSQHRASPNGQTTNHRQAEYTCDPEEHFPRMRLRLRLSPREPSSQPSSLKAESPSSEATTLPALPPPTTRWSKKRRSSILSHLSTDSRTSSMDDLHSTVSDATTMPALQENRPSTRTVTITRSLSCTWCSQSGFPSVRLLSLHLTKCPMRPRALTTHSRSTTFSQIATRNKLGLSIKLWPCGTCGLKFRSKPVLRSHMTVGCQRGRKAATDPANESRADKLIGCPGCPKTAMPFDSTEAVLTHLLSLKPGAGHPYGNHGSLSTPQLWPALLSIPNLGFGCHICGLLLASESRLDKHKRAVHEAWLQNEHQKALSPQKRGSTV